jgi:hypothetical protein
MKGGDDLMGRTLARVTAVTGASMVLPAMLGMGATPGHADDRGDDRGDDLIISIESVPRSWEQPKPDDPNRVLVTLSGRVAAPVTVLLTTQDGTAVAPHDYAAIDAEVTVPAGELTAEVPIDLVADRIEEPEEWFLVTVSSPSVGGIGTGQALVTIVDGSPPAGG